MNSFAVVLATLASIVWVVQAGTNAPEHVGNFQLSEFDALGSLALWVFQSIAAFPTRAEQAPATVYIIAILILLASTALGFLYGHRRQRWLISVVGVIALVVPLLLTLATFRTEGLAWQGRYGLPYSVGIILVTGWALDTRGVGDRRLRPLVLAGWTGPVCHA